MNPGGPGWNDPPALSYETHTQTTSRRNLLTKRVGLPDLKLPEGEQTNSEPKDLTAPPKGPAAVKNDVQPVSCPPKNTDAPPVLYDPTASIQEPSQITGLKPDSENDNKTGVSVNAAKLTIFNPLGGENAIETSNVDSKSEISDSKKDIESLDINFMDELKNLTQKLKDSGVVSGPISQTILKKLEILEKQVLEKKLPEIVERKMVTLTKYLVVKMYDDAWKIHQGLMCDHSSVVMQWMVGVKRLISEAKRLQS